MADTDRLLDRRHEHWILASMLLVLHAALDATLESTLSRALMTAHLGLFFLWQPIWRKDQRLELRAGFIIVLLVAALVMTLSWATMFAWLIVLIGIVAGRPFSTRNERYIYMVSLVFLVSELLIHCVPPLFFGTTLVRGIEQTFRLGLYLLPLVLYAIPPVRVSPRLPFAVDFFRGITFALMTALMAVLSVLMTAQMDIQYPLALVMTLTGLGVLLFFLAWLTTPGASSVGLLAMWEKSVLNIGTPFETWLGNVANLAAQQEHADDFLEAAIAELYDIPWISGLEWSTGRSRGEQGKRSRHHLSVDAPPLKVTLYTERSFSSTLLIHCRLLIQVLGHFYAAKQRENDEANEAHMRAIYETGARVTHDIKNLLQSLNTMAGSLQNVTSPEQETRGFALIRKRLPDIAQRLQFALDKLQQPSTDESSWIPVAQWWQHFTDSLRGSDADTEAHIEAPELELPAECFDSVVENLVDNVRHKIAGGQASNCLVRVDAADGTITVTVSDDGEAIPGDTARQLFRGPIASRTGLGIGLYQAARQSRAANCDLKLTRNTDGDVAFSVICPRAPQSPAAAGSGL